MNLPAFMRPPGSQLTPVDLHSYQREAINHQCTSPHTALWLDMGLGKTVITLSSIVRLQDTGWLGPVLVVATKTVVDTVWMQQSLEWSHTQHLKFVRLSGNPASRLRRLQQKADVYLINYENLQWLSTTIRRYYLSRGRPLPFNGVVWDEISKMKDSASKRATACAAWLPYTKWRTGLTGTPAGNGYMDLHGQYKVLDGGLRLGTSKSAYKERWFRSNGPYKSVLRDHAQKDIHDLIADITIEMSEQEYLRMPPMITNDIYVDLPEKHRAQYQQFEDEMFFELENGTTKEVFNAAARTNTCLQFANGAFYLEPGEPEFEVVHDLKLDVLARIIEESAGQPLLVAYAYKTDAKRIMQRFRDMRPVNLTETKDRARAILDWQAGKVPLMVGHPASMGHGTDGLQKAGHIAVWFGPNWSLELYKQFNARLRRQGQRRPVMCHRILVRDTLDIAVVDALAGKDTTEQGLRSAIRRYRGSSPRGET